jgi:hypothetical protein
MMLFVRWWFVSKGKKMGDVVMSTGLSREELGRRDLVMMLLLLLLFSSQISLLSFLRPANVVLKIKTPDS